MNRVRHILAAVDQFPQSEIALGRAVELARAHDARLTIVHIVSGPGAQVAQTFDVIEGHLLEEQALTLARERIEDAIRTHDIGQIVVDIRVDAGLPPSRIVEISNELSVDLVVMRAHQRQSILEKMIGSTTDRVVRSTTLPVLVVKRPIGQVYREAVIAVDLSDVTKSASILSAEILHGLKLQLVHVVHVPQQFEQALLRVGTSQAKMAAYRRSLVELARDRMRDLATQFAGREPAPRTRVIEGEPADLLVRMTWNPRMDLIAVAPHERGAIRRALLGSVTQRLLREAACDVLISRPLPAAV